MRFGLIRRLKYVCMYVCMFEASERVCLRGGSDSLRKTFSIERLIQFFEFCEGGTSGSLNRTQASMYVCMKLCMYVCMYVCMFVVKYVCMYIHTVCMYTYMYVSKHTYIHTCLGAI